MYLDQKPLQLTSMHHVPYEHMMDFTWIFVLYKQWAIFHPLKIFGSQHN